MTRLRHALAVLLALAPPAFADTDYYLVDAIATQSTHAPSRAQAHVLRSIYADLADVSGVEAQLVWSTDPDINAIATEVGDEKIVVVNEGLLAMLGGDRDAVAATLGHELAHHKADHIRAGRRKQEGVRVFGAILGAVVGAKVGRNAGDLAGAASAAAVGVGAHLVALKFNRNQELEADRLAIEWMIAAGYNPRGMTRLQAELGAMGPKRAGILSTHPPSAKRQQAAEKHIAKLAPPPVLLERPVAPLVGDEALADASGEIEAAAAAERAEEERTIAAALQPETPTAEALAPIDGVAFETYAALGNELLYAGAGGKPKVLAKHALTQARMDALSEGFTARMRANPALAMRYSTAFFRASQGRFAAHGRDLADSLEHGRPLALDPPYPVETGAALHVALNAHGTLDAARQAALETQVLGPHGLTYYDFLIAHNWWARKATVAALGGDTSLMQAYFSPPAGDAKAAGVNIGKNVTIGKNVKVGGKE